MTGLPAACSARALIVIRTLAASSTRLRRRAKPGMVAAGFGAAIVVGPGAGVVAGFGAAIVAGLGAAIVAGLGAAIVAGLGAAIVAGLGAAISAQALAEALDAGA